MAITRLILKLQHPDFSFYMLVDLYYIYEMMINYSDDAVNDDDKR